MQHGFRSLIKRVLPHSVVSILRTYVLHFPQSLEQHRVQRILAAAPDAPEYLDINALETLQRGYPSLPEYGYDAHALEARGLERATQILFLPGATKAHSFLELGCWDGMVSCCLCRKGKSVTAIDNRTGGFDERASREGVSLLQMDAADLRFEDGSFDFVFSYDAFEHFSFPEAVLREAIRVVRIGGYVYLQFGPLYYSPFGQHAYRSITVPYCQFLFERDVINEFVARERLIPVDFAQVNGWSVERYRGLWRRYSGVLKRAGYQENLDLSHLSVIGTYPSCFKSKSDCFDNFIVSGISVLFRKTGRRLPDGEMNGNRES